MTTIKTSHGRPVGARARMALGLLLTAVAQAVIAAPGDNELISFSVYDGLAAGPAGWPSVSETGRFVAFSTAAASVTTGDHDQKEDVFLRDRSTGHTERLSIGFGGIEANGASSQPRLTPDGRNVLFFSYATNLVAGDANSRFGYFLRDRLTGSTRRVTLDSDGVVFFADVSDDGRFVAFETASNLYLRDLQTGTSRSIGNLGSMSGEARPVISGDARFVLFGKPDVGQIALYDRMNDSVRLIDAWGYSFDMSRDGRWLVFVDREIRIVLLDRETNQVRVVTTNAAGELANSFSDQPSVSDSGRYVSFRSEATNLVPGDVNRRSDCFVKDMVTGSVEVALPNCWYYPSKLSGDGRFVAGVSWQALLATDQNLDEDVYLHEVGANSSVRDGYEMYLRQLSIDFGTVEVGTIASKGFTLKNAGEGPLPIRTIQIDGLDRAQYAIKSYCPPTLQVSERCWISVKFKPGSAGLKQAKLLVAAGDIERHRSLRGTGAP